jgi:D-inositol-3-phosphate glycosyltransferase
MAYAIAMLSMHTSPLDQPGRTRDIGGMSVYIHELAQELAQHHLKIDIFTRWTNETIPHIVQLNSNVRVIHIKAGPVSAVHKSDLYQYIPAFTRHIEDFRRHEATCYDVIHSHYWLSSVAATQLACDWHVPHITMFHTLGRLKQLTNPNESELVLRLDMEQRLVNQVDRIITSTSDECMQIICNYLVPASRIEIVPGGVDLKLFVPHDRQVAREQLGWKSQTPILLFAGRLDPFKGPDLLLRATAMMQEKTQVVIVGGKLTDDKDVQQLQILANDLGISDRVQFLGDRPHEEMPLIYSASDITVIPSYYESFGLVAVESLACDRPVVATRIGGLNTIVRHGETGFLVSRSPASFAEQLDILLRDPTLYMQMCAAARPSVLQFGWHKVAHQIKHIYEELSKAPRKLVDLQLSCSTKGLTSTTTCRPLT